MPISEDASLFWTILARDGADVGSARLAHYDEHRAYLNAATIEILAAGPTVADDGETPTGSFFVVRGSQHDAEAFNQGDPFSRHGVWADVSISQFLYRRGKIQL